MSWTKRQFITQALEELGLAAYVYDSQPEQLESARIRLDAMMASWNGRGIRIGYPLPTNQDGSDLDDYTNVPDIANEAIYKNLAIKLAPSYGKAIGSDTRIDAKIAYDTLLRSVIQVPQMSLPTTMPLGSGHKNTFDNNFITKKSNNQVSSPQNSAEFFNDN